MFVTCFPFQYFKNSLCLSKASKSLIVIYAQVVIFMKNFCWRSFFDYFAKKKIKKGVTDIKLTESSRVGGK